MITTQRLILTNLLFSIALYCIVSVIPLHAAPPQHKQVIMTIQVKAKFSDVIESLTQSIQGHGANIAHIIPVQQVLDATANEFNEGKQHYLAAQTIQFCSSRLSHALINEASDFLVFCPFAISVYELPSEAGEIYLSYRNPEIYGGLEPPQVLVTMKEFLQSIVEDGTQWFARVK